MAEQSKVNRNFTVGIVMRMARSIRTSLIAKSGKAEIFKAYHERSSLRGFERTFGVSRQTVSTWLKAKAEALPDLPPLSEPKEDDVLELDELWSFVGTKKNKRWVWIALCRRTRQIVACL